MVEKEDTVYLFVRPELTGLVPTINRNKANRAPHRAQK